MKPAGKFDVGQTVLLFSGGRPDRAPRELTITRVGRKNAYVEVYGREVAFNMETGWEVRSPNAAGVGDHILTFEQHKSRARRVEIREALDRHGFRPVGYGDYKWSNAVLEKVLEVLDAGEPR